LPRDINLTRARERRQAACPSIQAATIQRHAWQGPAAPICTAASRTRTTRSTGLDFISSPSCSRNRGSAAPGGSRPSWSFRHRFRRQGRKQMDAIPQATEGSRPRAPMIACPPALMDAIFDPCGPKKQKRPDQGPRVLVSLRLLPDGTKSLAPHFAAAGLFSFASAPLQWIPLARRGPPGPAAAQLLTKRRWPKNILAVKVRPIRASDGLFAVFIDTPHRRQSNLKN